jgi:hypothetical protein
VTVGVAKWIVPHSGFDLRPAQTTSSLGGTCRGLVTQREAYNIVYPPWHRPA